LLTEACQDDLDRREGKDHATSVIIQFPLLSQLPCLLKWSVSVRQYCDIFFRLVCNEVRNALKARIVLI